MYYDRDGQPIDIHQWNALLGDPNYKIVWQSFVNGWHVNTVWLGVDYGFAPAPIIFETSLCAPGGDDEYIFRYATEETARAGHERVLEALRSKPEITVEEIRRLYEDDLTAAETAERHTVTPHDVLERLHALDAKEWQ